MTRTVESYVAGHWMRSAEEGVTLVDASTGAPVAIVGSSGPDAAAMVAHARQVGGPAIRALTFHERALLLKQLALHLNERRDELYALSFHTGATQRDALIDIDGGIGVLFSYSGKGRRELPNSSVVLDGPSEPLGKGGTFVGQHVYVSRAGTAVQINAFNFPVWGMLEKFAPAFMAGLPTIVKPATPTAYLAEAAVRQIVESGILPAGSLQLLTGSPAGLLDLLDAEDAVAFTGSAATAARLRAHPTLAARSVRLNIETDSLNCSILGPDAVAGTPEFDLFVKILVHETTSKAGQKCTAIRRAFVPRDRIDEVVEAVRARLDRVVIGHPAAEGVTMGALVGQEQRAEVRRALAELGRGGRLVLGDPDRFEVVGADAERGAFLPPLLFTADPDRPEPHEVEAFGPVTTLLPYDGPDDAVALAARGRGSLVGSIASFDRDFVRQVVLGAAPLHGRLLVLDREDAKEQTGHGSPLPVLVHGGPGRAGGGEELGGVRSVLHQMQRTAIQGSPSAIASITGVWTTGAATVESAVHPFRKTLEELVVGERIVAGPRVVTDEDVAHFTEFTGDRFYAHTDDAAAAANPFFGKRVAHGYLVLAFAAGLFVDPAPGPVLANYGLERLRFIKPTFPGDEITVALTVQEIVPRSGADYGEVRWDVVVTNQDAETVATYELLTLVAKLGA